MVKHKPAADRIARGKKLPRHLRINQRYTWTIVIVHVRERPPARELNPESAHIRWTHDMNIRMWKTPRLRKRHTFNRDVAARVVVRQRDPCSQARGFDARQRAHTAEHLLPKIQDRRIFAVLPRPQTHSHRNYALGPNPGIHREQAIEALHHQPRA